MMTPATDTASSPARSTVVGVGGSARGSGHAASADGLAVVQRDLRDGVDHPVRHPAQRHRRDVETAQEAGGTSHAR